MSQWASTQLRICVYFRVVSDFEVFEVLVDFHSNSWLDKGVAFHLGITLESLEA
jgi:hypothetical protein